MDEARRVWPVDVAGGAAGAATTAGAAAGGGPNSAQAQQQQVVVPPSTSKTVTDTIIGEHEHTIVGYSLVKGIGDGEPIASERFTVGGHEWVLLFYPDGKRSSSAPPPQPEGGGAAAAAAAAAAAHHHQQRQLAVDAAAELARRQQQARGGGGVGGGAVAAAPATNNEANNGAAATTTATATAQAAAAQAAAAQAAAAAHAAAAAQAQAAAAAAAAAGTNDYAALFVALIGETGNPQGVVNTSDGRVVRAFHRFTLVDQTASAGGPPGRDLTKGRRRDQGAVKISCARQDPNARNCHGYRKFVKRSVLENPAAGYLVNDTIVIRYTIELVVSTGGALARPSGNGSPLRAPSFNALLPLPPPSLGADLARLLRSGAGADVEFEVEGETMRAHRAVLSSRSPVFDAMLNGSMREAREVASISSSGGVIVEEEGEEGDGVGKDKASKRKRSSTTAAAETAVAPRSSTASAPLPRIKISDVRAPVFRALLHFAYTDELPEEVVDGGGGGSSSGSEESGEGKQAAARAKPATSTLAVGTTATAPPTTTAAFAAALSTVGSALDVPMAQHLLVAADRFSLSRLRRICERRLCERVSVSTAATTLALAEQNNAEDLKRVCLSFVSRNLQAVMASEGYRHMIASCPNLQSELLAAIAASPPPPATAATGATTAAGTRQLHHHQQQRHTHHHQQRTTNNASTAAAAIEAALAATAALGTTREREAFAAARAAVAAARNNGNNNNAAGGAATAAGDNDNQGGGDGGGGGRRVRPRAE